MATFLDTLLSDYKLMLQRHRNRPMLRAAMAGCALAAVADGEVTLTKRIRVDQILSTLEALKVFDPHDGVDLFNDYCAKILEHPASGHDQAIEAVKAVAASAETAELLIRICLAVIESKSERQIVDEVELTMLCSILSVDPEKLGIDLTKIV